MTALQPIIEAAWEVRDTLSASTDGRVRGAVEAIIERLDEGTHQFCSECQRVVDQKLARRL